MKNCLYRLFAVTTLGIGAAPAIALDLPTSGICGLSIGTTFALAESGLQENAHNLLKVGTINFSTKMMTFESNEQLVKSGGNSSIAAIAGQAHSTAGGAIPLEFKFATSTSVSGMHMLTLSNGNKINVITINNGKTILMQFLASDHTSKRVGLCQF